jgi:GNAT superfamily N-acetyltransferase
MPDMLVKLYELPDLHEQLKSTARQGVLVRRPSPWERPLFLDWVRHLFSPVWAAECETAFAANPPSCFIALQNQTLVGFACHDCTRKNFFGPTGVAESARGKGVGLALLLACLHAMRDAGYAYAVIGGVGPAEYYSKTVGATMIAGSTPGIYDFGLLRKSQPSDG